MVLEVCASAAQLVCAPARSLWPTLASAGSTLALFAAANWGFMSYLSDEETVNTHLMMHIVVAFAMPLFPLKVSFENALQVWFVKRTIQKDSMLLQQVHKESIAILCTCPLYLQVPSSTISSAADEQLLHARDYQLVGDPKEFCPLELAPATILNTDQQQQLQDSPAVDDADNEKKYLRFPGNNLFLNVDSLKERELLLTFRLAPEYSQLRFLRSRSRFQTVVTTLQAGGYVFSVVQRLAQHLAVCPLEALLCFHSVIIILQLLLELYACSRYQRPLLLRLNHHQFSQFWGAPRDDTKRYSLWATISSTALAVLGVLALPFSALSIYYSVHYMHSCLVCSVAALLFFFALLLLAIGLMLFFIDWKIPGTIMFLLNGVILLSSMVLAVVATAKDWDLFHSPTNNSFSWILPHVSSQA